ncbi:MAG: hypothetical protein DRJ40_05505 [Thermoprotei archaeon]|nr:MAG: hypothetical protein DRJ40_04020 [Thermoprotei archaeon]RLE56849.1 MAG: hypothetical protein DRJ40_05505 [Thermoprotei archaeon]
MKVTRGQVPRTVDTVLLTGNGVEEVRVLKIIAEKFNHRGKVIIIPTLPTRTGVRGVIEQLSTLLHKTRPRYCLIIIDREHVPNKDVFSSTLKQYGFEVLDIKELNDHALVITCRKGPKQVTIYIAISGFTEKGNIEENIRKLREVIGEAATKEELLKRASMKHLEQAFPGLTTILKLLSENT